MYEENELYAKHPTPINGIKVASSKVTANSNDKNFKDSDAIKDVEMAVMNGNGNNDKYAIRMTNVCAKWSENSGEDSLSNLNIDVEQGRLLAIIGPVGAGKVGLFLIRFMTI